MRTGTYPLNVYANGSTAGYRAVRAQTNALCAPLATEDLGPQSMPEASPTKWHLAHTSWFFERFILQTQLPDYRCFHPGFDYLFNSYYQGIGPQHPRTMRGLLSRPTVAEIYRYREYVDEHMTQVLAAGAGAPIEQLVELGVNHEQQHQELLLTDIKHLLFSNPLQPAYRSSPALTTAPVTLSVPPSKASPALASPQWRHFDGGLHDLGADPQRGFCFDNETPRHRQYTAAFAVADQLVTNGEFREFVRDEGYRRAALWLSDGWEFAQAWQHPLYWNESLDTEFTLDGPLALEPAAPVCHLSYYEADAYARWAGARLPTEAEWERAVAAEPISGNFVESAHLHPRPRSAASPSRQFYGDVWEWTASAYLPYPGFRPWAGTIGEYNGKFMANQFVLRGGSCATPRAHIRATYRNFFYPQSRWQFAGIRLAKDP